MEEVKPRIEWAVFCDAIERDPRNQLRANFKNVRHADFASDRFAIRLAFLAVGAANLNAAIHITLRRPDSSTWKIAPITAVFGVPNGGFEAVIDFPHLHFDQGGQDLAEFRLAEQDEPIHVSSLYLLSASPKRH